MSSTWAATGLRKRFTTIPAFGDWATIFLVAVVAPGVWYQRRRNG